MNSPVVPNVTNPPVLSPVPIGPDLPAGSIMRGSYRRLASSTALFTIMMLAATPPSGGKAVYAIRLSSDSDRKPCAIVPPNGPAAAARGST